MRSKLPSGTITFLFTDIEGSTKLLHELGDGYAEALAEHRRLLRKAFMAHGGMEVDTQGDAFFVAFATASDAVAAAGEGQRALEAGPIRVRMGLHTGEAQLTEEGYVGLDVHKAARIAACGHGGQVLLSEQTAQLVEAAELQDLGQHRLKDLSAPERLYQLGEGEFPSLKTLYRTNLPIPATPFLGRERELEEVTALLSQDEVRLLTLTGPGGTGTIREFAAERLEDSGEGDVVRRRLADFFFALAESAHLTFEWADQRPDLVAPEADNLRAAMTWARSASNTEFALRIATALEMFWVYTNPLEGMRWYGSLLEDRSDLPLELLAHALRAYGSAANPAGDDALAERLYEQSLEAFQELGDERGIAHMVMRLGVAASYRGDYERAHKLGEESLTMSRQVGDQSTEALSLWLLGEAEYGLGDRAAGMDYIARSADLAGAIGFTWQRTRMLRRLADWAVEHGDVAEADRAVQESLRLSHEIGDRISVVFSLARLARLAGDARELERAGLLWGAVEAEEEHGVLGAWYDQREKFAVPVLAHAGPEFEQGRIEGRLLSLDEAVEKALSPGPES